MIEVQFDNLSDLETAKALLNENSISTEINNGWANRSVTRDVSWGVPVPADIEEGMEEKTFMSGESLVAPISFTKVAQRNKEKTQRNIKNIGITQMQK